MTYLYVPQAYQTKPARHSPPRCVAGAGIAGRAPGRGPLSKHRIPLIGSMLAGAGAAREDQVSSSEGVALAWRGTGATPQVGTGSTIEAAGATGVSGGSVATGGMRQAGTASETAAACAPGEGGVPTGGMRPAGTRSATVATGSDGVAPSSMQQAVTDDNAVAGNAQGGGGVATRGTQQAGTHSAVVATGAPGGNIAATRALNGAHDVHVPAWAQAGMSEDSISATQLCVQLNQTLTALLASSTPSPLAQQSQKPATLAKLVADKEAADELSELQRSITGTPRRDVENSVYGEVPSASADQTPVRATVCNLLESA